MQSNSNRMILSHFSQEPVVEWDLEREYPVSDRLKLKPAGLWLSDEKQEMRWSEFCLEAFSGDLLKHLYHFDIDSSEVAVITSNSEFEEFYEKFKKLDTLDYEKLRHTYKGLVITPYLWDMRLKHMWYYGWDCASGCIWDLSCVLNITEVY